MRYLHAVAQFVQLLVVDWTAAVRWAGLCSSWRDDLIVAGNSSDRGEDANLPPSNFLFMHLYGLKENQRLEDILDHNQN